MDQAVGDEERAVPWEAPGAARKRAAVETYTRNEEALRRTASRFSICADDAEDALQRALEILLRKAPSDDPRELIRWTQTVVKHEALAVRRERERILAGPAARQDDGAEDWVALIPSRSAGPSEQAERHEVVARSREALSTLKPQELRALTLLAEGYSYREIGRITGFSQTKVNRCLAEGRERFRGLVARSEDGRRCAELRSLLSVFCDGEAGAAEAATVREHLRACPHCRATLRAYRAAPAAAAALAPALPLHRGLVDRFHDAVATIGSRLGGGGADSALSQVAAGGGARGAGAAALAKAMAICAGTVGGAAACVATGIVPVPLEAAPGRDAEPALERQAEPATTVPAPGEGVEYAPAPAPVEAAPQPADPEPQPEPEPEAPPEPAASGGAVEYAPPQPTAPARAGSASGSESGSAAGEFGP
ncbi:MAG: sigma-70 family RNA polymerase sigma factor [Solirubrobacterales bacterium]